MNIYNSYFDFLQVIEVFRTNKIMGKVMSQLTDSDLKELGIRALGNRKYFTLLVRTVSLAS